MALILSSLYSIDSFFTLPLKSNSYRRRMLLIQADLYQITVLLVYAIDTVQL